jgi:hypothetical protein
MAFVVRTAGDPYAAMPTLRRAAEIDPLLPLANVKTMESTSRGLWPVRGSSRRS